MFNKRNLSLLIGSISAGMFSVFNTSSLAMNLMANEVAAKAELPQVVEDAAAGSEIITTITGESIIKFFSHFGIPAGFSIIFGLLCVVGTIYVYRDMKKTMAAKDKEIKELREDNDDLKDKLTSYVRKLAVLETEKKQAVWTAQSSKNKE